MIQEIIQGLKSVPGLFKGQTYRASGQVAAPVMYDVADRGVKLSDKDVSALRPILYGEVGNRDFEKKNLESRVIVNTAINRMKEYASRGQQKTLAEVLAMPNQYQAFGGQQYKNYSAPPDDVAVQKKQDIDKIVDTILEDIKAGRFSDNTQGAFYYQHTPEGKIYYDNTRQLFKTNLGKK